MGLAAVGVGLLLLNEMSYHHCSWNYFRRNLTLNSLVIEPRQRLLLMGLTLMPMGRGLSQQAELLDGTNLQRKWKKRGDSVK
jgi:hypothetical protein